MRNQIRKKVYTLIISLLALGAWAQKSTINVYPLLQAPYLEQGGIIYNLPANKLIIKLTVKKLTVKTGPFKQYAEKYLGDASVHQTDKVAWRIDQIDITTSAIPDSTQYYVVATNGNSLGSLISLTDELYLQSVNEIAAGKGIDNSRITLEDDTQPDRNIPNYSRVSMKQTMVEKIDTVYRQVQTDTMIVRIPTIRRQLVEKSPEEKARELSQLLFALRDDKNALIKGEGDGKALPDGTALQQMLSEMNALEKEYLALFIGTSWTENYTYTFEYTPKTDQENDRTVLFKFATTDGILPVTDRNGEAILLEINKTNKLNTITNFQNRQQQLGKRNPAEMGLAYRIPAEVFVKLSRANKTLFSTTIAIPQLGTINQLPADIFKRNNLIIRFNPKLGSLIGLQETR